MNKWLDSIHLEVILFKLKVLLRINMLRKIGLSKDKMIETLVLIFLGLSCLATEVTVALTLDQPSPSASEGRFPILMNAHPYRVSDNMVIHFAARGLRRTQGQISAPFLLILLDWQYEIHVIRRIALRPSKSLVITTQAQAGRPFIILNTWYNKIK